MREKRLVEPARDAGYDEDPSDRFHRDDE